MKIQKANTRQTTSHQTAGDHSASAHHNAVCRAPCLSEPLLPAVDSQVDKAKGEASWESALNSPRVQPWCLAFLVSRSHTPLSVFPFLSY